MAGCIGRSESLLQDRFTCPALLYGRSLYNTCSGETSKVNLLKEDKFHLSSIRQADMQTIRRKDRLISDAEAFLILENGEYGILSTVSADHEPYGVPVNYCLQDGWIYFHCALEGRKIDNILNHPKVSFCVVGRTRVIPDQFGTNYESCIVEGIASEAFGDEKQRALEGLVHKYSPDFVSEGLDYIEKLKNSARVFKISIESISGKAKR